MDISYLAITLEHSTKDLLKVCLVKLSRRIIDLLMFQLANDYVNRLGKHEITANDIDLVMNADNVKNSMLFLKFYLIFVFRRYFSKFFVRI